MKSTPLVAIGIATFQRPQYLADLLSSLQQIELADFTVHLLIVDNDPAGGAESVVAKATVNWPFPLTYVIEPKRGHPAARNRLVRETAKIGADFLDIVDDDQIVTPDWLTLLMQTADEYDADAVWGLWLPLYDDDVPDWVRRSGYFATTIHRTGTRIRYAADGTTLFRMSALSQIPGPFDENKGLSGGADTVLFDEMYRRGYITVRCAESIVYERIAQSRANAKWMIMRSFGAGVSLGSIVTRRDRSLSSIAIRSARSVGLIAKSILLLPPSLVRGRSRLVPQIANLTRGIGFFVGAIAGRDISEAYKSIHGR